MNSLLTSFKSAGHSAVVLLVLVLLGVVLHKIIYYILNKVAKKTDSTLDDSFLTHFRGPSRIILLLLIVTVFLPAIKMPAQFSVIFGRIISIVWVFSIAFLIIRIPNVVQDFLLGRYKIDVKDNLEARKIHTQFEVFRKIVVFMVTIVSLGIILMNFDKVRQLGASILASAGILGLVAGLASQRILANMLAGIQIAITQPIRIDDVVIVENEWGRIEDITLTYIVVKIWDLRRLVLPISYFIEKPFQNWTRNSAEILGTVFIYVDYTVPVDALRAELGRILKTSEEWDKNVCGLQVTNTTEHTVELRALMSSSDASKAWNLRCYAREKLIEFVQKKYPGSLPKQRVDVSKSTT